jgi:hypothetical protein
MSALLLLFFFYQSKRNGPKLFLEESVLKLDAGVTAVAERHVVG